MCLETVHGRDKKHNEQRWSGCSFQKYIHTLN